MSEIGVELLLRVAKLVGATVIGVPIYLALTGWFGATPGSELALLSWLAGGMTILLLETSAF